MIQEAKKLWLTCFADSEEFVEMYFSQKCSEDNCSGIIRDGQLVSALQRIPYDMTYRGERVPMSYISGACTHPQYRSQGLMGQLLAQAHQQMYRSGIWLATLLPAEKSLNIYYARHGYHTCFARDTIVLGRDEQSHNTQHEPLHITGLEAAAMPPQDAAQFLDTRLSLTDGCVLHDRNDLHAIMLDLQMSGGSTFAARDGNGQMAALALCVPDKDMPLVKELLCRDKDAERQMTDYILNRYDAEQALCTVPSSGKAKPAGMARVINAQKMLEAYARHTGREMTITVTGDNAIVENNGTYRMAENKCVRINNGTTFSPCRPADIVTDIASLAQLLFEGITPYMNLMLD